MFSDIPQFLLDGAADYAGLVLLCLFAAATLEAAFGLGAVMPGEMIIVVGAVALRDSPLLVLAVIVTAAGAFAGDHVGFWIGRKLGPATANTKLVRKLGVPRWHRAMDFVSRRGMWIIIVARLLPGVRTLISAAAGAAPMPYRRFMVATATAAMLWSLLWVGGGAAMGLAIVDHTSQATLPLVLGAAVVLGVAVTFRAVWTRALPTSTGASGSRHVACCQEGC